MSVIHFHILLLNTIDMNSINEHLDISSLIDGQR